MQEELQPSFCSINIKFNLFPLSASLLEQVGLIADCMGSLSGILLPWASILWTYT